MNHQGRNIAILLVIVLIGLLMWFFKNQNLQSIPTDQTPATGEITNQGAPIDFGADITTALFVCEANKKIGANFKERGVILNLSDGRSISLPQTISASGARYANKDESFVFWNKGDTAFIEESGKMTYTKCNTAVGEFD